MASFGQQAFTNFKNSKQLVSTVLVVLVIAFAGIVSCSYTADHIKKSKCSMSTDASLNDAYKWATGSAVVSALLTLALVGVLVKVAWKRSV
jgi:hypothetical protein